MRPKGEISDLKGLELVDAGQAGRFEHRAGGGPLDGESRDLLGDFADFNIEADRRIEQPIDLALRRAEPIFARSQAKHGAVVDEMAGIIAPDTVGDSIRFELREIA